MAKDVQHEAVQGFSQMNKEHLLPALCRALGIDVHEHYSVSGIDKAAIKAQMRELKQEKQAALEARDHVRLHQLRRRIHALNRQISICGEFYYSLVSLQDHTVILAGKKHVFCKLGV